MLYMTWKVPFSPNISPIFILYKHPHPRMHWGWPWMNRAPDPGLTRQFLCEVKLMDAAVAAGRQHLIANTLGDVEKECSGCVNGRPGKRLWHITRATAISRCKQAPSHFSPFLYYLGSRVGMKRGSWSGHQWQCNREHIMLPCYICL